MGYELFCRIACFNPSNINLVQIGQMISDYDFNLSVLESVKCDPKDEMMKLSGVFPHLIFGVFWTGDSHELSYLISHHGHSLTQIEIEGNESTKLASQQVDYNNQLVGSVHDLVLCNHIKSLGMTDISHIFQTYMS